MLASLKTKARSLLKTPLHPQWLLQANSRQLKSLLGTVTPGSRVLDIGCYNKWTKGFMPADCDYVGLDYYETASDWYGSVPDLYGNALALPLAPASFDCALLLDVMEHIEDSRQLLAQIQTVLQPGGRLIMSVPFLYPIHDAPRDFSRPTVHGIHDIAAVTGFEIESLQAVGSPLTTAALLTNIALAKTAINWLNARSAWSILTPALVLAIPVVNLCAWLLAKLEQQDAFMANSYQVVLRK